MTPKKKGKSKAAAADAGGAPDDSAAFDNTPPLVLEPEIEHYVTLDMRLLNWSYLNFKIRTKTTTRLFAIKQQIRQRHGPITELKLCKDHFSESNELLNDLETLEEYGITGAPEGDPEAICLIHYDFKPEQHDNPLLLASEQK